MKHLITLLLLLPIVAQALTVDIAFQSRDSAKGDGLLVHEPALRLVARDANGKQVRLSIDTAHSGAMSATNWTLHHQAGGKSKSYQVKDLKMQPSGQPFTTQVIVTADGDATVEDMGKDAWRVVIKGSAAQPALTLRAADGTTETIAQVEVAVPKMNEGTKSLLSTFVPFESKFDAGGGEDGSLYGLSFTYKSPARIVKDNDITAWHAQFEGSFTNSPDDALSLYGRFQGDAGWFRSVEVPASDFINGSLFLDLNTHFESDQQADNYNYTVGAGVWGFLSVQPLVKFSSLLYGVTSLGQEMKDAPILTLYAGYDFVAASQHDATAAPQGENRARFRARYRTPIWRDLDLPIMPTAFDVDAVADYAATWDFRSDRVFSEFKGTLEFMPQSVKDRKLAFTLSYVSGQILPTFVDEEAFLAGLRWKF
jgi:hypothetical protein